MKRNLVVPWVVILLVGMVSACSPAAPASTNLGESAQTQAVAETPAPVAIATAAPAAVSSPTSLPIEAPAESASIFPLGKFVNEKNRSIAIQYNEDGTFEFYSTRQEPVFVGNYAISGDLITSVNPADTDPKCMGEVTYSWSFDGERLTFEPTGEDPCRPRREANADVYILEASLLPELKIFATDYAAPKTASEGWVVVTLANSGSEPHHVEFLRLNDGVTREQFEQSLVQGQGPALALVKQMGGVGSAAPGVTASSILNLPAGEYILLCFIESPDDHAPHFAKGMINSLTVEPAGEVTASEPTADLEVSLADYAFAMPDSLPAGPVTIKVTNEGPEPHEFNILKLAEGKTAEDVLQYLSAPEGPPPFTPVGGMNGLDPGISGYVQADLQPGSYAAICFIPSPKAEGHPHFALGMIQQFMVTASEGSD